MITEWYSPVKRNLLVTTKLKKNSFRKEWGTNGKLTFQGNFIDGIEKNKITNDN